MASIIGSIFKATSLFESVKPLFLNAEKSSIGDLVIDATIKENISLKSKITRHPIEDKTAISDHIFLESDEVTIEGVITDNPIRFMGILEMPLQANSVSKLVDNLKGFLPFGETTKPSETAYRLLRQMRDDRILISVVTKLQAFNNMGIESLEIKRDQDTGASLEFTAHLVKVNLSRVRTTANVRMGTVGLKDVTNTVTKLGESEKKELPKAWGSSLLDWGTETFSKENVTGFFNKFRKAGSAAGELID